MKEVLVELTVNGTAVTASVEPRLTLAGFLRRNLALTGTHLGCEHGVCGACTVIVDGAPARGCLMFAAQADGTHVVTIEGLSSDTTLSPLQRAMRKHHGLQCGFCTPGIITTMHAFLQGEPNPTAEQVRDALSGNICRCTGYLPIVEAVLEAAAEYPLASVQ